MMRKEAVYTLLLNVTLFHGMCCSLAQDPRYLRFSVFEDGTATHYNLKVSKRGLGGFEESLKVFIDCSSRVPKSRKSSWRRSTPIYLFFDIAQLIRILLVFVESLFTFTVKCTLYLYSHAILVPGPTFHPLLMRAVSTSGSP